MISLESEKKKPGRIDPHLHEVMIESRESRDAAEAARSDLQKLLVAFKVTDIYGLAPVRPLAGHRNWWGVFIGRHDGEPMHADGHTLARLMLRRTAQRMAHFERRRSDMRLQVLDDLACVATSQACNVKIIRRAGASDLQRVAPVRLAFSVGPGMVPDLRLGGQKLGTRRRSGGSTPPGPLARQRVS